MGLFENFMKSKTKTERMVKMRGEIRDLPLYNRAMQLEAEAVTMRESVREMRDILNGMNFGDSFPAVKRAIRNADSILSNTKATHKGGQDDAL